MPKTETFYIHLKNWLAFVQENFVTCTNKFSDRTIKISSFNTAFGEATQTKCWFFQLKLSSDYTNFLNSKSKPRFCSFITIFVWSTKGLFKKKYIVGKTIGCHFYGNQIVMLAEPNILPIND